MVVTLQQDQPDTTTDVVPAIGELRMLPLSKIKVVDGFNPRTDVEKAEIDQLAASIAERGILQPVLVRPVDEDGDFPLTDGGRRILAAGKVGLMEVPALIRRPDERTDGLDDALIANLGSVKLNAVEQALGFKRLREMRLTAREIAKRTPGVSERVVRERLRILDVSAELWPKIADKTIPLAAVETLAKLDELHHGLAVVAVKRVLDKPVQQWDAPVTWDDMTDDPISVVIGRYDEQAADLPAEVYVGGHHYGVDRFALSEKTTKSLGRLCKLLDLPAEQFVVTLGRELVEQAAALGAAYPSRNGYESLIVGQDVADQLAGDYIGSCLKAERAAARARAEAAERTGSASADATDLAAGGDGTTTEPVVDELEEKRRRRAEQEAAKEAAAQHNEALGLALVKHLSKIKVDARVLKLLTAADLSAELQRIAARGARYGFPGWVTETETKGKVKRSYLPPREAGRKAYEYLAGAKTGPEIAGRSLALIAMARHADERAVAESQRSFFDLRFSTYGGAGLPWTGDAAELLDELLIDKLPEPVVAPIRQARDQRAAARDEADRLKRERTAIVVAFAETAAGLTREQREAEITRLRTEHGYDVIPHGLGVQLLEITGEDPEPTDPPDAA